MVRRRIESFLHTKFKYTGDSPPQKAGKKNPIDGKIVPKKNILGETIHLLKYVDVSDESNYSLTGSTSSNRLPLSISKTNRT